MRADDDHRATRLFGHGRARSPFGLLVRALTVSFAAAVLAAGGLVATWSNFRPAERLAVGTPPAASSAPTERVVPQIPLGAFLGSGEQGVQKVVPFQRWLGTEVTVGHTYLPGERWEDIEGSRGILEPWARWRRADPDRQLVVNVPMVAPNEDDMDDGEVARHLRAGASGKYDRHFRKLAERLVGEGVADAILVVGWEMNGDVYSSRCGPDKEAWKAYWRRIVQTMRAVPGTRLRFDFTASRGPDAVPWVDCYPGDDVVDIIGSDSYDQPEGGSFERYVAEPYGLEAHARFAALHGKPMSFPEWGLFRNSDNPEYIQGMYAWMVSHNVIYQTITDYCPHGVWSCDDNPRSSTAYRELFGGKGEGAVVPAPSVSVSPSVSPPGAPSSPPGVPPVSPPPAPAPAAPPAPAPAPAPTPDKVPARPPASSEVTADSTASVPDRSNAPAVPAPARPSASATRGRASLNATAEASSSGSSGGTSAPVPG